MEVLENAKINTILISTRQLKKYTGLQPLIQLHLRVSPTRSSSKNRSSSSTVPFFLKKFSLPILREEILGETRLGNPGRATTASGIFGHLGAKTNCARHSRKVIFSFNLREIGHQRWQSSSERREA